MLSLMRLRPVFNTPVRLRMEQQEMQVGEDDVTPAMATTTGQSGEEHGHAQQHHHHDYYRHREHMNQRHQYEKDEQESVLCGGVNVSAVGHLSYSRGCPQPESPGDDAMTLVMQEEQEGRDGGQGDAEAKEREKVSEKHRKKKEKQEEEGEEEDVVLLPLPSLHRSVSGITATASAALAAVAACKGMGLRRMSYSGSISSSSSSSSSISSSSSSSLSSTSGATAHELSTADNDEDVVNHHNCNDVANTTPEDKGSCEIAIDTDKHSTPSSLSPLAPQLPSASREHKQLVEPTDPVSSAVSMVSSHLSRHHRRQQQQRRRRRPQTPLRDAISDEKDPVGLHVSADLYDVARQCVTSIKASVSHTDAISAKLSSPSHSVVSTSLERDARIALYTTLLHQPRQDAAACITAAHCQEKLQQPHGPSRHSSPCPIISPPAGYMLPWRPSEPWSPGDLEELLAEGLGARFVWTLVQTLRGADSCIAVDSPRAHVRDGNCDGGGDDEEEDAAGVVAMRTLVEELKVSFVALARSLPGLAATRRRTVEMDAKDEDKNSENNNGIGKKKDDASRDDCSGSSGVGVIGGGDDQPVYVVQELAKEFRRGATFQRLRPLSAAAQHMHQHQHQHQHQHLQQLHEWLESLAVTVARALLCSGYSTTFTTPSATSTLSLISSLGLDDVVAAISNPRSSSNAVNDGDATPQTATATTTTAAATAAATTAAAPPAPTLTPSSAVGAMVADVLSAYMSDEDTARARNDFLAKVLGTDIIDWYALEDWMQ